MTSDASKHHERLTINSALRKAWLSCAVRRGRDRNDDLLINYLSDHIGSDRKPSEHKG